MRYTRMSALAALSLMALAGCNLEQSGAGDGVDADVTLDATAGWAHFSLASGGRVDADDDWDLAFSRTGVRSNPDRVELALVAAQDDFYDGSGDPDPNIFTNATANSELEHLLADPDVDGLNFAADGVDAVIGRDGENYNDGLSPGSNTANTDAWWLLKSAEGDSFAKVNFTNATYDMGTHVLTIEADFYVQASGEDEFDTTPVGWTTTSDDDDSHCFDFDAATTVDCETSTDWDVQYTGDGYYILTNGGISGEGDGGVHIHDTDADEHAMTEAEVDAIDDASDLSAYAFASDQADNAFADHDWYAYNLQGSHGIWPNYRVYAVRDKATDAVALFQITGYYNDADESGHISLRYRQLD